MLDPATAGAARRSTSWPARVLAGSSGGRSAPDGVSAGCPLRGSPRTSALPRHSTTACPPTTAHHCDLRRPGGGLSRAGAGPVGSGPCRGPEAHDRGAGARAAGGRAGDGDGRARGRAGQGGDRAGDPAPGRPSISGGRGMVSRFHCRDHRHAYGVKRWARSGEIGRSSFSPGGGRAPAGEAGGRGPGWPNGRVLPSEDDLRGARMPLSRRRRAEGAGHPQRFARVVRVRRSPGFGCAAGSGAPCTSRPTRRWAALVNATSPPDAAVRRYVGAVAYLAAGRRLAPVPGAGGRLVLPRVGGVGDRRPHAHRVDRRRAARRATRGLRWRGGVLSEHGSQYSSKASRSSRGPGGDPVDGRGRDQRRRPLAESFNASLTRDTSAGRAPGPTEHTWRRELFGWVNRYNARRRHSDGGQQAPIVYEQTTALRCGLLG